MSQTSMRRFWAFTRNFSLDTNGRFPSQRPQRRKTRGDSMARRVHGWRSTRGFLSGSVDVGWRPPRRPEVPRALENRWFYRKASSPDNDPKDARRGDANTSQAAAALPRSSDRGPNGRVRTRPNDRSTPIRALTRFGRPET